jgi:hypothetical protein
VEQIHHQLRARQHPPHCGGPITAAQQQVFDSEITAAVRYEKGLVIKLAIALVLVALVIVARLVFYG